MTTIDTTPVDPTNQTDAVFTFSCNEPPCTFECRIDTGGWAGCVSGQSYSALLEGNHIFDVRATDEATNLEIAPPSYSWRIDLTPPITTILTGPPDPVNSQAASFTFVCSEDPDCTFECQMDAEGWVPCSSPANYSGLSEATHTFYVRATDEATNPEESPKSHTWRIDITPPETTINTYPVDPTNSTDPVFTFSANETDCSFECRLDSGTWESCLSPFGYTELSDGSHTFDVRATDLATNTDPSPASYTWTVDTVAPETTISSSPPNWSNNTAPSFSFTCNEPSCTFECQMDSGGFSACTSPKGYTGLAETSHTFQVRATDPAINTDASPASYTWTIDITPPETYLDTYPNSFTPSNSASFTFHSNEPGTFECRLDSGSWTTCVSGVTYSSLTEGLHTFLVRAIDLATNVDTTPSSCSWTVDWTPPNTMITNQPGGTDQIVYSDTVSFTFTANEPSCTFECSMTTGVSPGGTYEPCISGDLFTGLKPGDHTFSVRAIDRAGNTDPTTADYTFEIVYPWADINLTNTPTGRFLHTMVWTGSEAIVWGGFDGNSGVNTGARYDPSADAWYATSTSGAPSPRYMHSAVWADTKMIVWGGYNEGVDYYTGGRYDPTTNSWTATSTSNAPSGRDGHTAVWTNSEMIVWGGYDGTTYFSTGGRYNPAGNSWTATNPTGAPTARTWHTAVWTGSVMVVWGGYNDSGAFKTGSRYTPSSNSWSATLDTGAPAARYGHTAVSTGTYMIVWGGENGASYLNDGATYNLSGNTWSAIQTTGAPSVRAYHSAIWTGVEMIVWGGWNGTADLDNGGRYNLAGNSWRITPMQNVPTPRDGHTAIWTGTLMFVWGGWGLDGSTTTYYGDGKVLEPPH